MVQEYIKRMYGFTTWTKENDVTDTVGTSVTTIAKANPNRVSIWIANLSANTLYVGTFADVSSSKGFYIAPNGGNAVFQINDDFLIPSREWFAIAGGAASDILVLEILAQ